MANGMIISLILSLAPVFNIDPYVALAVAYEESSLNPKAVGTKGEVGLFQIMPQMYKQAGYTKKQMEEPLNNIYMGLRMLQDAKKTCVHKGPLTFLVCYNAGPSVAKKIRKPASFAYVVKVKRRLIKILDSSIR